MLDDTESPFVQNPNENGTVDAPLVAEPVKKRRSSKDLDEMASALKMDDPIQIWRVDLALTLWGNWSVKSTILAALMKGNPDGEAGSLKVPALASKQAYVYYHRMIMDMQAELTKSKTQKQAEARGRRLALAKAATKDRQHKVVRDVLNDVALIDHTESPLTTPRAGAARAPEATQDQPELYDLSREQLMAIALTGKLPAPRA